MLNIDKLVKGDTYSVKGTYNRYVKVPLDNGVCMVLRSSYSELRYDLLGYYDTRDDVYYSIMNDYDVEICNCKSYSSLVKEYKTKFEEKVSQYMTNNSVELLASYTGTYQAYKKDAMTAFVKNNSYEYSEKFKYDGYSNNVNDIADFSNGVALDYLVNPEKTLDREVKDFLDDPDNRKCLGRILAYNKNFQDAYNHLCLTHSTDFLKTDNFKPLSYELLVILNKLYLATRDLEVQTAKVKIGDKVLTLDVKDFVKEFDRPSETFWCNCNYYKIEDIEEIKSRSKVIYKKGE